MQNINLLNNVDFPVDSSINGKLALGSFLALIFILAIVSIITSLKSSGYYNQLIFLENSQKKLLTQIEQHGIKKGPEFVEGVDNSGHRIGSKIGFHKYFRDLARYTPKNVWLTHISLSRSEKIIVIKGHTLFASDVARFIIALGQSPSMKNRSFDVLNIKKNESAARVDFTIATDVAVNNLWMDR